MSEKSMTLLVLISLVMSCSRNPAVLADSAKPAITNSSKEQEQWLNENQIGKYDIRNQARTWNTESELPVHY